MPADLDADAVPGARVRVRFAGQLVDGYLLERVAESEHPGTLARLQRVVSPEPVLSPEVADLAREVANRWPGTLADVLRLAIPPRHARIEAEPPPAADAAARPPRRCRSAWAVRSRPRVRARPARGRAPARAVWSRCPAATGPAVAAAVAACRAVGRGALSWSPHARDLARLGAALDRRSGRAITSR